MPAADSQSAGLLRIERHNVSYELPSTTAFPAAVRRRLDRVCAERLPVNCSGALGRHLDGDDPSVWLIPRLEIELEVDTDAIDDAQLSRGWSDRLAGALREALFQPEAGVRRLADRGELLASFLSDAAAGRAADRWEYAGLGNPRERPFPRLMVELFEREPGWLQPVLERLGTEGRLDGVLRRLEPLDAWALLARGTVVGADAAAPTSPLTRRWVDRLLESRTPTRRTAHHALRLLARGTPSIDSDEGGALLGAARWLEEVCQLAVTHSTPSDLLAALEVEPADGRPRTGRPAHGSPPYGEADLHARDSQWLERVVERTLGTEHLPAEAVDIAVTSPFAALFLLLPCWIELGFETLLAACTTDETTLAWLRLRTWIRCFDRRQEAEARGDDVLSLVARLDAPSHQPDAARQLRIAELLDARLAAHLTSVGFEETWNAADPRGGHDCHPRLDGALSRLAAAMLAMFAHKLPGFATSSRAHLRANFLSPEGHVQWLPGAVEVLLEPVPLSVVLRMAGLTQSEYTLPWLDGTAVRIRPGAA